MSWLTDKFAAQVQRAKSGRPPTFWNGERRACATVRVIVGKAQSGWWCAGLEGTEREAVRVGPPGPNAFYLDNDATEDCPAGQGWAKVTTGRGHPKIGHRSLPVLREVDPKVYPMDSPGAGRGA